MKGLHDAVACLPAIRALAAQLVLALKNDDVAKACTTCQRRGHFHNLDTAHDRDFVDHEQHLVLEYQRAVCAMTTLLGHHIGVLLNGLSEEQVHQRAVFLDGVTGHAKVDADLLLAQLGEVNVGV
ncbi:hypothetical protein ALO78_200310 [Pseudomonas amygdali pv. ciccaronei]|nr:hypothetical protein ALO78_200310 [Pseudomonas amygdali pv. ciccaronei]